MLLPHLASAVDTPSSRFPPQRLALSIDRLLQRPNLTVASHRASVNKLLILFLFHTSLTNALSYAQLPLYCSAALIATRATQPYLTTTSNI